MRNILESIGRFIRQLIDFFYPPFSKYFSIQFFRYGASGGINLLFDWVLYYVVFNYVLHQEMLHLGLVTFSSHIAALVIKLPISLFSGFLLQKYVTFSSSPLRGRVQLARYFLVVIINIGINFAGLKILVDILRFFPSIANVIVSLFTTILSYFLQRSFTFKQS